MAALRPKRDPRAHAIAGVVAGTTSTIALFPLDLVKVRFQVDQAAVLPSIWRKGYTIVTEEGWRTLFSGLRPALVASALSWGGFFYFYERAKARVDPAVPVTNARRLVLDAYASVEAGCIIVLLTNPVWLVKTRLQLQTTGFCSPPHLKPYKGAIDALQRIVREEGWRALYRGLLPSMLLTSHGAVQLVVYEQLKRSFGDPSDASAVPALAYGAVAKLGASLATYPYQVVKTRVQRRHPHPESKYSTDLGRGELARTWRCVADTWRHEGPRGFFKGCWPSCIRVVPNAAITFWVYEMVVNQLGEPKGPASAAVRRETAATEATRERTE